MSDRTVVSTFSGIGGIDLGLERAGWTVVAQAEKDAYRRAVLAERFPGVECADDVRGVAGARLRGREPQRVGSDGGRGADAPSGDAALRHDLLCGGFPCQDLSVAGRRAGLAGARSGLFFAFADVAESLRPRWLLVENVPGLLSSNGGRDFGELAGTLADLGYGVAWRILDSRFFGVPQRRRRVFIVGCDLGGRAGAERAGAVLAVGSGCGGHPAAGEQEGPLAAGIAGAGPDGPGRGRDEEGSLVVSRQDPIHLNGSSLPLGRKTGGNGVFTHALTSEGHDASEDGTGRGTPMAVNGASVRRLTPRECERLQGFPDDWTRVTWRGKPAADSLRYAACGDAVTVPVAEWLGRRLMAASA